MSEGMTALQAAIAELKKVGDQFQQVAHETTGIVPAVVKPVIQDAATAIEDVPSVADLLATIANLKTEMTELKTRGQSAFGQLASQVAAEFASGGDPVDHTLHLDNGTTVQATGLSTHIANADGTVNRVIAAYPTNPTVNR